MDCVKLALLQVDSELSFFISDFGDYYYLYKGQLYDCGESVEHISQIDGLEFSTIYNGKVLPLFDLDIDNI